MITDAEIASCRRAFETGHEKAAERAAWVRNLIILELGPALELAGSCLAVRDEWLAMVEAGVEWICTAPAKPGQPLPFTSPIEEAERCFDEFIAAEMRAVELFAMLQAIDDLIAEHGTQADGPTREIMRQVAKSKAGDPLLRLVALGKITQDELNDAREIAGIVHHIAGRLGAKTMYLPVKSEVGNDETRKHSAADTAEWYALLHAFVYVPWTERVREDVPLVLGLVVEGRGVKELRRTFGMRWDTVLDRIKAALREYRMMRRNYLKVGVDADGKGPNPRQPLRDAFNPRGLRPGV